MHRVGSAALFYRGPGEDYSNRGSIEQRFEMGAGPQTLKFSLPCPAGGISSIKCRLLTPDTDPPVAYLKILSVTVARVDRRSNAPHRLAAAFNHGQLEAGFNLGGLVFDDRILGELYVVEEQGPWLEYEAPDAVCTEPDSSIAFEAVLVQTVDWRLDQVLEDFPVTDETAADRGMRVGPSAGCIRANHVPRVFYECGGSMARVAARPMFMSCGARAAYGRKAAA